MLFISKNDELAAIVIERNDLIHHLLPKWNMHSLESSAEIEKYLDQQREKILPELEILKSYLKAFKEFIEYFASDEGKKEIDLLILRQSQLVAWFYNIAEQKARPDGWAALNDAINIIRQHNPNQLADLEKKFGYKKLKETILATEFFDIYEEPTKGDGIRLLYRIKPDLHFVD